MATLPVIDYRFGFRSVRRALKFLQAVGTRWDITMFHYRNQADYGRVLAGIACRLPTPLIPRHLNVLHFLRATEHPATGFF